MLSEGQGVNTSPVLTETRTRFSTLSTPAFVSLPWSLAEIVGAVVRRHVPGAIERLHDRREQGTLLAVVQVLLQLLQVGHPHDHRVSKRTLESSESSR